MPDLRDQLVQLKNAITEDNWCQNTVALNKDGERTSWLSGAACKWCLEGHLLRLGHSVSYSFGSVWGALRREAKTDALHDFNDEPGRTVADIHNLIQGAIDHAHV